MLATRILKVLGSAAFLATVVVGCGTPSGGAATGDQQNVTSQKDDAGAAAEKAVQLGDKDLQAKLTEVLKKSTFSSEADFPFVVLEGQGGAKVKSLTSSIIRVRLAAAIKKASDDHRDIGPKKVRSRTVSVAETLSSSEADAADDSLDEDARASARGVADALKLMKSQLQHVVAFNYGTNDVGDQDEDGNVIFVFVGVSKTTGKLIAIMTQAVFT